MIYDTERNLINEYHAQALQNLLELGYIDYEKNKLCTINGYTIDQTIHFNDCQDCQRTLIKQPYPSYPGKAVEPNQMAGLKQHYMYWDDPSLTY